MDGTRSVPEPMWDTWQPEPCLTPGLPSGYHRHQQHLCLHYWYHWTSFGTPTSDFPQKTIDYSGTHLLSCFVFEQKIHPKAEKLFFDQVFVRLVTFYNQFWFQALCACVDRIKYTSEQPPYKHLPQSQSRPTFLPLILCCLSNYVGCCVIIFMEQ